MNFDEMTNAQLDEQVVRLDTRRAQKPGVQRFLKAMHRAGAEDPLDGPDWVVPGILMEGQTMMCPGAPGSGKSFAILDWLARISQGRDFLGKPVKAGGVVYVTGEGQGGLAKRVAALASEYALDSTSPFLYVTTMPHMLVPQQVSDFTVALKIETEEWQGGIRVIAFDTFNRAIVGGSENEGKDVTRLFDADNLIKEVFGCSTIYVHHPGKAEGNDMRGHSSLLGDSDVVCAFSGKSGTRTIEVKKQKDESDGGLFAYSLRSVHLGAHKATGDPVTSCLVDWVDQETAKQARSATKRWPKGLTVFHDAMTAALLDHGQDHRPCGDGPVVKAVAVKAAHEAHRRLFVSADAGDPVNAERQAWHRRLNSARNNHLIASETAGDREVIWLATEDRFERNAGQDSVTLTPPL